eukprot:m51a1_g3540 hypothetical protein (253) ;mRNA; r:980880-981638
MMQHQRLSYIAQIAVSTRNSELDLYLAGSEKETGLAKGGRQTKPVKQIKEPKELPDVIRFKPRGLFGLLPAIVPPAPAPSVPRAHHHTGSDQQRRQRHADSGQSGHHRKAASTIKPATKMFYSDGAATVTDEVYIKGRPRSQEDSVVLPTIALAAATKTVSQMQVAAEFADIAGMQGVCANGLMLLCPDDASIVREVSRLRQQDEDELEEEDKTRLVAVVKQMFKHLRQEQASAEKKAEYHRERSSRIKKQR